MDGPERVEVPASRRRLLLAPTLVVPTVLAVLAAIGFAAGGHRRWDHVFQLVVWAVVVVVVLVSAWRRRHLPALILDAEGIRRPDGELLVPWAKVALVWVTRDLDLSVRGDDPPHPPVGSRRWRSGNWSPTIFRPMRISVWDDPAFEFARRASFRPTARVTQTVPTELTPEELVALVEPFTRAPVETGDRARQRQVLQQLTGGR